MKNNFSIVKENIVVIGRTLEEVADRLINIGDISLILLFVDKYSIENIEKTYLDKLTELIIAVENPEIICEFAIRAKGANVERLEDAFIACCNFYCNGMMCVSFAREVKGANIARFEDLIVTYGNSESIYNFANRVKGANITKLEDAIIARGDVEYIYQFARCISGADIEKLENAVIECGCAYYMTMFAKWIKGADIDKLDDGVFLTGDEMEIFWYACFVHNTTVFKFRIRRMWRKFKQALCRKKN